MPFLEKMDYRAREDPTGLFTSNVAVVRMRRRTDRATRALNAPVSYVRGLFVYINSSFIMLRVQECDIRKSITHLTKLIILKLDDIDHQSDTQSHPRRFARYNTFNF